MSELLAVRDKLNVSVRELSLGERMKMELIASLLHQPKVLFLDEPTIGLDVVSQKIVREFLRDHNAKQKTTILLTSHYMADIQELCERVIIIDHGTIFFDGRLSEVVDRFADFKLITIQCEGAADCLRRAPGQIRRSRGTKPRQHPTQGQTRPRHPGLQGPARRTARAATSTSRKSPSKTSSAASSRADRDLGEARWQRSAGVFACGCPLGVARRSTDHRGSCG